MRGTMSGLSWCALSLLAPACAAGQVTLGAHGGYVTATVADDELVDARRRSGLTVGASAGLDVADLLSVELGASYTQKGVRARDGGTDIAVDFGYIEIPLLARLAVPTAGRVRAHAMVGPAVSVQSACEVSATQLDLTITVDCDDPSLEGDIHVKSVDVGALLGLGASVGVTAQTRMTVDVMYELGLRSIDALDPTASAPNRALMVVAGVRLSVGG